MLDPMAAPDRPVSHASPTPVPGGEEASPHPRHERVVHGAVPAHGPGVTGIAALDAGIYFARQRGGHEVLVLSDVRYPIEAFAGLPKDIQLIFGVADEELMPYYSQAGILAILSPGHFSSAISRVQYAIFRARAAGLLPPHT